MARMKTSERGPHPVDIHVGIRLKMRRLELHLGQEQLAAAVGLTFQQIQKYQRATNRISASRLFELSQALGVSPAYFFEGLDLGSKPQDAIDAEFSRAMLEVMKNLKPMDPILRQRILDFIKAAAEAYPKHPKTVASGAVKPEKPKT